MKWEFLIPSPHVPSHKLLHKVTTRADIAVDDLSHFTQPWLISSDTFRREILIGGDKEFRHPLNPRFVIDGDDLFESTSISWLTHTIFLYPPDTFSDFDQKLSFLMAIWSFSKYSHRCRHIVQIYRTPGQERFPWFICQVQLHQYRPSASVKRKSISLASEQYLHTGPVLGNWYNRCDANEHGTFRAIQPFLLSRAALLLVISSVSSRTVTSRYLQRPFLRTP